LGVSAGNIVEHCYKEQHLNQIH